METQRQKAIINLLYGALVLSTVLSFVPLMSAQTISLVLVLIVLIAAYGFRGRDSEDGLMFNHMTYLIGTVWIGTGFVLLGMTAAGIWVYLQGDHSLIHAAAEQAANGGMPSEDALNILMRDYMAANRDILVRATLITVGPAVLYFVYRVANGYARACRGYRIANPKGWL